MSAQGSAAPITGRCFCGAVTFACAEPPVITRACWCRDCQYLGAGNATVNAIFRRDAMTVRGALAAYASRADSGTEMRRSFCPRCGTQLFSESASRPQLIVVRVGALDDPNAAPPSATIWTRSAPRWACIDPALPRTDGQPPPLTSP
ncbi:MAG: GFA family protein [Proteobacteria bacterium]|nr:GFA family protein [Pseudomonadota bacterium]